MTQAFREQMQSLLIIRSSDHQITKERFRTKPSLLYLIYSPTPGQGQGTFIRFGIYGWRLEIVRAGIVTDAPLRANNC